jgi:dihydroxy-acid dehydratase
VLVDLKPTGQHYMSDLFAAGGIGAVLRELKPLLHLDCLTVTGETLGERLSEEPAWVDRAVVKPFDAPYQRQGGLVALFGSLAPNGAILKRSAADPSLFEREGRAVVFSSLDDMAARIDTPELDVQPDDFLVLQNAGPKSGYAMPEAGYLPIPQKLARAGVKDMVRISDARMSGTAFGTIVLHVSPEAAIGGPLAFVRNGDRIRLSVEHRRIELCVDEAELARRRKEWTPPVRMPKRGYANLYMQHVLQAEDGCDFDFLQPEARTPKSAD